MLSASGHKLYFYYNASRDDASNRMEIDFLISKSNSRVTFLRVYYFPCSRKLRETISIHSFSHFSLFYQHLIYFFHIIFRCRRNHGLIHLLQLFRRCLQCICDLLQVLSLFYLLYQQNDLALLPSFLSPFFSPLFSRISPIQFPLFLCIKFCQKHTSHLISVFYQNKFLMNHQDFYPLWHFYYSLVFARVSLSS